MPYHGAMVRYLVSLGAHISVLVPNQDLLILLIPLIIFSIAFKFLLFITLNYFYILQF